MRAFRRSDVTRFIVLASSLFLCSSSAFAAPIRTQLAGESFADYPHFHYVRNFNPDEAVEAAVDPTRFPQLVGESCDLYVVEARNEIGWILDDSLVDVRPSGAQSLSFGGGDIQSNTFTIAAPGLLDDDAGAGLGVGYDVVLDCNENGILDDGDLIDGRGDEPGLYAVHDTTLAGPLAVSQVDYTGGFFLTQRTSYPSGISTMGRLPLVVISHGWTHEYEWYDHIGQHLASYGYVVMSHRNDVGSGGAANTLTAAATTLSNTDYILNNVGTIAGGVLDGHVDTHRIAFIGHSTGGEGVVRAYTRVRTGDYVSSNFSVEDIALVTSLAPVSFHPIGTVDPADVNYFLILGAADTDTQNAPVANWMQPVSIFERAYGNRQFVYMHGVGHGWLHAGNASPFAAGPDLIGQAATHTILRGYFLPVMELYLKENLAGRDFFTRSYEDYHPAGIDANVVIANEYRDGAVTEPVVIDDHQTEPASNTSSSGGAVTFDVSNVEEVLMQDLDSSFVWTGSQPSNGMTRARFAGDDTRCVTFDWSSGLGVFYELEVPAGDRDFTERGFLSFRAAQATRHPRTNGHFFPMSFQVELRDGGGNSSAIDFGSYGELTFPYQRTGYGSGAGWANEFNTIRIRLDDFTTNGSGVDLSDVVAIRFKMGQIHGAKQGRIGLDDVELVRAFEPEPFELSLSRTGIVTTIRWPPVVGAETYDVYRGTIPDTGLASRGTGFGAYDHTCFEAADAGGDGLRVTSDDDSIALGNVGFYYLVATGRTGGGGSLGLASSDLDPVTPGLQIERPQGTACP